VSSVAKQKERTVGNALASLSGQFVKTIKPELHSVLGSSNNPAGCCGRNTEIRLM